MQILTAFIVMDRDCNARERRYNVQPFRMEMDKNRCIRLGPGQHEKTFRAPLYFSDSNSDSSLSVGG